MMVTGGPLMLSGMITSPPIHGTNDHATRVAHDSLGGREALTGFSIGRKGWSRFRISLFRHESNTDETRMKHGLEIKLLNLDLYSVRNIMSRIRSSLTRSMPNIDSLTP
jgi:hypothetical protein